MRQPFLILLSTLSLAGCASSGGGKLPVCDGKHPRPGNPYGSVLAPAAEGAGAAPVGAGGDKPKTLSAIPQPAVFGSCA